LVKKAEELGGVGWRRQVARKLHVSAIVGAKLVVESPDASLGADGVINYELDEAAGVLVGAYGTEVT
jgi:hypothetical protein